MNPNNFKGILINKRGFTLVELLVVALLLVLVVFTVFNFMITSGNLFNMNSAKADAQSQSRLIFQGIKTELSTAKTVEIVDTSTQVFSPQPGEIGYQVDDNQLVMLPGSTPAFNNTILDSLEIQFVPQNKKLLKMIIIANGEMTFETEIYSPNIDEFKKTPTDLVTGNAIIIKP